MQIDIKYFKTGEEFAGYLKTLQAPRWFTKVAIHHTVVPTVAQWNGLASMNGMLNYYKGLGWDGTPHVFIAPDGIWLMNKLTARGVHTNAANLFAIGVEVVGFYDKDTWKDPIYTLALQAIRALQEWRGISITDIVRHNTYNPTKTCPGSAITHEWIITQLQNFEGKVTKKYMVKYNNAYIREGPSRKYPVVGPKLQKGDTFISTASKEDEQKELINGLHTWEHVTKAVQTVENVADAGFVHRSMLEEL